MGKRHHYVYLTCDSTDGRLYWGSRTCDCPPEKDDYFGSHKDDTFNPDLKYVWAEFDTRLEADDAEDVLHKLFNVVESSTFANLSKRTFRHWEWEGSKHSPSTCEKLREQKLGEKNPRFGKPQTQKQKDAVSRAATGRRDSETTTKRKQLAQKENARLNKKGKSIYHNPETNQQKYFHPQDVPNGWVKGLSPKGKQLHQQHQNKRWDK